MANLSNNNKEKKSIPKKVNEAIENTKDLVKDVVENPVEVAEDFAQQATKDVTNIKWWAKLLLYFFWIGLSVVALFFITINLSITKQWAANQALNIVNQNFKAKMSTESVQVDYFGDVTIKGLKIEDEKGLNFITAEEFRASSDWLRLISNAISGSSNSLSFKTLQLHKANVQVITYKGDSISNFIKFINNFDSGKPQDPNKKPFQLNSRVEILDSKVSVINENSPGNKGKWLDSEKFNLIAPNVKINGPNISAQIKNTSFETKRWGKTHFMDTFSAEISLTKDFLSLKDLTMNTPYTLLQGDLKFKLNNGSWADFTNRVRWDMNLKTGSQISGYDISYFITDWDNYTPINLSGKMQGTLNQFYLENFVLGNYDVSIASKTISLKNIFNGNFLIETRNISTDFTYIDLKAMLPTFISEKMKNFADDFGRMKYNGAVKINPEQIYILNGNLITDIGQAEISQLYLTDYSSNLPKYRGYANVKNLNTTIITKMPQVGLLSGNFYLDGQSFDVDEMVINTKSDIHSIDILNKNLKNIALNGILDKKTYKGFISINDANADANIEGYINFKTEKIEANWVADIQKINLNYFTGKPELQTISGKIDGNISMSTLNDLELNTQVANLHLFNNEKKYSIPNATAKIYKVQNNQVIEIDAPNAIAGRIAGEYQLSNLSGMIDNAINKILVGPDPRHYYRAESFNLEFDIKQGLVNFLEPNLKIPNGITISGSYDGDSNHLVLNADAEKIRYIMVKENKLSPSELLLANSNPEYSKTSLISKDSLMADNIVVKINTANIEEQIFAKIENTLYQEHWIKDFTLIGKNNNNEKLHLAVNFEHGNASKEIEQALKFYSIKLNQSTNEEGDYIIKFEPTELKFNAVNWNIDTNEELNHSIIYKKKKNEFIAHNLRFYSDNSSLILENVSFKSSKDFHFEGKIQNLEISKILEMQKSGNEMNISGIAHGDFNLTMVDEHLEPLVDLNINNLIISGKPMGNIIVNAKKSNTPNIFDLNAKVKSSSLFGEENLLLSGTIDNNANIPAIDLKAEMKNFDLTFTQEFVKTVFSNMRGKATGILSISGPINDIDYSGDIALNNVGMKLNFTGVDYSFEDTIIPLSRGLAILNNIKLKDNRNNSSGTISGAIQFETLASMAVQLIMRADNLMVLNTQQKDFDLFWGRVYGQGTLYVSGPVSGLTITTDQEEPFKALNNSVFTFNAGSTSSVDEYKMLRFLKEESTGSIVLEEKKNTGANIDLDFNIAVDKGTTVNVALPEDVGNISVKGTANPLRFTMSKNGNITMSGSYFVDSGSFVSQAILERTFQINRGSSMRWDGDAMTPALDIKTNYVRAVTNAGQYLGAGALPSVNVELSVNITGTLNNPNVDLGLDIPDLSSQLKEALATKMINEDEKVIQFGSILVLNSFNIQDTDMISVDAVANTGYNMLFKQLGSVFNTISNEVQIDLNYLKGDQASNTGDRANANINFSVSPRVTIKTGLGVPISRGSESTVATNYLSGEGIIEYDWSKQNDKTRLLRVYSKPSNIGLISGTAANAAANQTYGLGVVYSKSFNYLFRRKRKNNKSNNTKNKIDSIKIDSIK